MNSRYLDNAVLCYVSGAFAYFTTQPLSEAWGDDWDDTPYEHNAGEPYTSDERSEKSWEIVKIAFSGGLVEPQDGRLNSPFSVRDINSGVVPWLADNHGTSGIKIMAGASLRDFIKLIRADGGDVYLPVDEGC